MTIWATGKLRAHLSLLLHASAMLKHVIDIGWTSVRLSVRLSHAGTISKRLNVLS